MLMTTTKWGIIMLLQWRNYRIGILRKIYIIQEVCEQSRQKIGMIDNSASNMLKRMNIDDAREDRQITWGKRAVEENLAILFMIGADKYKNEKFKKVQPEKEILKWSLRHVMYYLDGKISEGENSINMVLNS